MPIFKTAITITVLGEFESRGAAQAWFDNANPYTILNEMDDGDLVGQTSVGEVEEVPESDVESELEAVGNDGTFFDMV